MNLVSATEAEFTQFLTDNGYTVAGDKAVLLSRSFSFLRILPFCSDSEFNDDVKDAQCFIAYSMSSEGGGFDPSGIASAANLTEKSLGRGAIVKKWENNSKLVGTEPLDMLRTLPMAYGLLKGYLCINFAIYTV